jgi:hypothetical protein
MHKRFPPCCVQAARMGVEHAQRADRVTSSVVGDRVDRGTGIESHPVGCGNQGVGSESRITRQVLHDQRRRALNGDVAHGHVARDLAAFAVIGGLDPQPVAIDQRHHRAGAVEHFGCQRDERVEFAFRFGIEQRERVERRHPAFLVGRGKTRW